MATIRDRLQEMGAELRGTFQEKKRVMSFAEYLELVEQTPRLQLRSAPQFTKDCFDHWGTEEVNYSWGRIRRFKLFDCPWANHRDPLLGQEAVQNRVYRALSNFVNEGAANKLILLHGPNGSAKSTLVRCIGRGLQAYSELDCGALYRFNWIFPKQKLSRSDIGFSNPEATSDASESFAHLPDDLIDARISDELRDHPLLLLPLELRSKLIKDWTNTEENDERFVISDYLSRGQLSHRNRGIFEALLANYQGDFLKVLRHVQVERFFISHRYREGYVTVEPQLSVDASEQQITQDSSISALPPALQSLRLFRYGGQLVTGNRGLIEYSDLLKRPLEAFKYLLTTVEHSSVSLHNANLYLDLCFIGTSNEVHLSAFKEIAEFQSFKGRLELIRVPYLLDLQQEERIYDAKLREAARTKHIAPHCAYVAALWAVMTRMVKPDTSSYNSDLAKIVTAFGPAEKAELYGEGKIPDGITSTSAKEIRATLAADMRRDGQTGSVYEGLTGASPRALQSVIFNAANAVGANYVSPLQVLNEIEELCTHVSVYSFLRQKSDGEFQNHLAMVATVRERLLDRISDDFRQAMGLVKDEEYLRVFERYILHVTHYTRGEKLRNQSTGAMEPADESLMEEIETTIGLTGDKAEMRSTLIAKIGAWSLDNVNTSPDYQEIFSEYFTKLRDSYFKEHEKAIAIAVEHFLMYVTDSGAALSEEDREQAEIICNSLTTAQKYTIDSARDCIRALANARYS